VPAGCPKTTGIVTLAWFEADTKIGHDPAPAETMYPVTAGRTSAPGVHRTTTPFEPM
jgi:hypothetical protein